MKSVLLVLYKTEHLSTESVNSVNPYVVTV